MPDAPFTHEEAVTIATELKAERERRRRLKLVNADGLVLFTQAEQSEMVHEIVTRLRT